MFLSILAAIFEPDFNSNFLFFSPALVIGGTIGTVMALKVSMISMPQMVAALHSFVGIAATIVSFSNFFHKQGELASLDIIETTIGIFIGSITFTGSVVACGKLKEWIKSEPLILCGPGRHFLNLFLITSCVVLGVLFGMNENEGLMTKFYYLLGISVLAGVLGWHLVMAIGGADMPVVVSMLNSYSGWATSASGFLLKNWLLIVTGALVGSSGAILSYIMCRAMNRSFISVISGGFGQSYQQDNTQKSEKVAQRIDINNTVNLIKGSKNIVMVPGYGMAVAHCQYILAELTQLLIKTGRKVKFCIHPVAGRLPGHMNVLLAEANVDYKIVKEMDEMNPQFASTDLVLVVGANDTVNPDAIDNPKCSIAGMPVCKVWEAKNVIVFKRGASGQGYSKAENPLFTKNNTKMFYGNAMDSLSSIIHEIKAENYNFEQTNYVEQEFQEFEENVEELLENIPKSCMTLGIPKEIGYLERRVAMTPAMVPKFRKLGFRVKIESDAGLLANFSNKMYEDYGGEIVSNAEV